MGAIIRAWGRRRSLLCMHATDTVHNNLHNNPGPGACVDSIGGAPPRVPVWETDKIPRAPAPAVPFRILVPLFWRPRMTPRKQKNLCQPPTPEPQHVIHPHAAGIDIHLNEHWVAVPPQSIPAPPANSPIKLPPWVRKFGTCTADLEALADWLAACGVDTVA